MSFEFIILNTNINLSQFQNQKPIISFTLSSTWKRIQVIDVNVTIMYL